MVQPFIDQQGWLRIVCIDAWTIRRHLELTLKRLAATKDVFRSRVENLCIVLPYTLQRRRIYHEIEVECAAVFRWLVLKKDLKQLVFVVRPVTIAYSLDPYLHRHPMEFLWSCTAQ